MENKVENKPHPIFVCYKFKLSFLKIIYFLSIFVKANFVIIIEMYMRIDMTLQSNN